ncbi:MAG: IS66 family transposase [Candidatus Kapabacteria bacterium]|nr:IS66 family transposase [Candidatus Kapabacteria bacterium]
MITNELISSLVFCKYKFCLHISGKQEIDDYAVYLTQKRKTLFEKYYKALLAKDYSVIKSSNCDLSESIPVGRKCFLSNIQFTTNGFKLHLDFLEIDNKRVVNKKTPVFIHPYSYISKEYRTIYQTISWKYSEITKNKITRIKVICGEELIIRVIKTNNEIAKELLNSRHELKEDEIRSSFSKNKYCNYCGNWMNCKNILIERDDISLLGNIGFNEISKYNNKGIFTINQLSYTYKPRRSKKTSSNRNKRFQYGLRALALREKKTIIDSMPDFKEKACSIFFDFESIPEQGFIYLIGLVILENGVKTEYSFWADNKAKEELIFLDFFSILRSKNNYTCYHYSSYELIELRAFNERNHNMYKKELSLIMNNSMNLLSVFNSKIHPPTYTNGLKDIAIYYGFEWTIGNPSGLKCLILREQWNNGADNNLKKQIIQYNLEDCNAMGQIIHSIKNFNADKESSEYIRLNRLSFQKYSHNSYNTEYFKNIAKYAYFDYQHSKVFLRTNKTIKRSQRNNIKHKTKLYVNKYIKLDERCLCPHCISNNVYKHGIYKRIINDLKFMTAGLKKWVTQFDTYRFKCNDCGAVFFNSEIKKQVPSSSYGDNLKAWVIYQYIACRVPMNKIQTILESVFKLSIHESVLLSFKRDIATKFRPLYNKLTQELINGSLLHVDETKISIRGIDSKGYVWVFTNMESVIFIFRKTREVEFLKTLLNNFKGVFISDFYAGYDNLPYRQQKCLIHLIRDLNDDLYKNPLDYKYKELVIRFGDLINLIVSTINKRGLKRRFLLKYKKDVDNFYKWLTNSKSDSDLFQKYFKRFQKNREKLFQFLEEDGIPWNNNNAEHGIKHFAAYRKIADGLFTLNSIDDYLILLSIFQTCQYRNIDFLSFLRNGDEELYE